MGNTQKKTLLLIEDDEVDVRTVKRVLKKNNMDVNLYVATNGEEALGMLKGDAQHKIPLPHVVILDLNMPRMNGIEFLQTVRSDTELRSLVVIILTTSENEQDIIDAYNLNVAGYIVKPINFEELINAFKMINQYWSLTTREINE